MIDYLEQGYTINSAYYAGELRGLSQGIARKRHEKLTQCVLLLRDITPVHTSHVSMTAALNVDLKSFLIPNNLRIWLLFQKLKPHLRGTQFRSNEGVIESVNEYLGERENAFYFEGIRKLEQTWA